LLCALAALREQRPERLSRKVAKKIGSRKEEISKAALRKPLRPLR